jgi:acyl-CoA thioester hydrolase
MRTDLFSLLHRVRVRWAEVDRQDIVFNGHYLTYFDVGVTEYWRAIGLPYPDAIVTQGSDLYAVKAVVEYHAPARYDDEIDIGVRVEKIGRSSLQFRLAIFRGQEHLISGELIYVNADPATRKSAPVPSFVREAIARFESHLTSRPPEQ